MTTAAPVCDCGEDMEYQPPYPAEPDTGTAAWRGGWCCCGCGRMDEDEPVEADPDY